jgi:hypothetical protein
MNYDLAVYGIRGYGYLQVHLSLFQNWPNRKNLVREYTYASFLTLSSNKSSRKISAIRMPDLEACAIAWSNTCRFEHKVVTRFSDYLFRSFRSYRLRALLLLVRLLFGEDRERHYTH